MKSRTQSGHGLRPVKIATWNINSIKAREDHVLDWLEVHSPDVLCLQETKVTDQEFPEDGFTDLDYEVHYFGQPTYNGVAILSRDPVDDVVRGFADAAESDDKRLIAGTINGVRIVNVYVPNGQAVGSDKYAFKLRWLDALLGFLQAGPGPDTPLILTGDFNIAPNPGDHYDAMPEDPTLFVSAPEVEGFRRLLQWGLTDSLHHHDPSPKQYTWWDYRGGAWDRNQGLRIDHVLMTASLVPNIANVTVHRMVRDLDKASDHVPVVVELEGLAG